MRAAHTSELRTPHIFHASPFLQLHISQPMDVQLTYKEGRITLALKAYKDGYFTSLRAAADAYDVPASTLRSRAKGVPARHNLRPKNTKLLATEETALIKWIISMEERGLPVRSSSIQQMADLLLQKRSITDRENHLTVGKNWVYNFVQRHDSLRSNYNRKYDYQRAKCEDPVVIRAWFRLVQNVIAKYGILDEDIYNFDETGFQMGVISTAKVITGSERAGRPVSIQPGNREWVTVIESVSASGWSLPPMVIFEGKVHISTWYTDILPRDWTIALSDKGWTDDSLGLAWLIDVFEKHTKDRTKGVYRLLILDGHGSHSTPEFDQFCTEHSIITLCMPPHSSHLLQPLDVSCFAVLKRSYGRQIEGYIRAGLNHIDKPDFLTAYVSARNESITIDTVRNGFTATGLVPFNPERVLSKLNTQLRTPTPPTAPLSTQQSPWVPETPQNIAQLELQAQTIKGYLSRRTQSPPSPTDHALNQLVKGCQMAMHSAILLADENRQLRTENTRQKKKKAQRKSYIAQRGVLTVQEGLNRVQGAIPEQIEGFTDQLLQPQIRTPRMCSICRSLEHTARTCIQREASN